MKTILKLYTNGDFEMVNITLVQSEILGNYSFGENFITVPKIIEFPSIQNYFIERTSLEGFIHHHPKEGIEQGDFSPPSFEKERISDYIDVRGWGSATVRVRFYNTSDLQPWLSIQTFDTDKNYLDAIVRGNFGTIDSDYYMYEYKFNINSSFIRVSSSHWGYNGSHVKISVEKGDTTNSKHYLAFEDMPEWAMRTTDVGKALGIFKEGIVIRGDLIHSNS